jgi:hypothetical protein
MGWESRALPAFFISFFCFDLLRRDHLLSPSHTFAYAPLFVNGSPCKSVQKIRNHLHVLLHPSASLSRFIKSLTSNVSSIILKCSSPCKSAQKIRNSFHAIASFCVAITISQVAYKYVSSFPTKKYLIFYFKNQPA